MSDNLPLYITNENYPSVTTRHESCSCSLEIYSCTANIQVYTLDTDLYLDESHCDQSLKFVDISNNTVTELNCESHYKNEIEINKVARHYTRVDFINNSTADQEGYFFIGLDSTEPLVSFVLNCGAERVTWCSECGVLPNITDGTLTLVDATNSSYGATAGVVCNTGYETNTPTVACLTMVHGLLLAVLRQQAVLPMSRDVTMECVYQTVIVVVAYLTVMVGLMRIVQLPLHQFNQTMI
ncbi:uncharacterized protein LOC123527322 [Mercenaria mercenaria]|uniref:uncharacterized protein LOC123527322 n=1 Tax=Mercenaria mercenaria TaxID=6596 RepID=UPI00234F0616|nr:uncharacterized protein LOC123527322 [Mercenaria mercenaria]